MQKGATREFWQMASLTAENGTSAGQRHTLTKNRYILGRHPECDIVVDAGAVSRHHAQVFRVGDDFFVEDMHSRNGTFVNDQMVFGRHRLKAGDRIRVCDIAFVFEGETPLSEDPGSKIAVFVDDSEDTKMSTIMSKLDVSSDGGGVRFSASPEAKLKALLEITRSLGKSLAMDQVLPQVLNSLFTIFLQADRGFIVLADDQGNLVPRWTKLRREGPTETIRISRTIINEVVKSKQAVLSADAAADERFEMSESIADFRIRSMICAPLIDSDGGVMGVIQIDTLDQRNRFRQEDLEVLVSVATQASVAIDNAKLHETLLEQRELARDLELAREVQKSFLPERPPTFEGYEFFDFYEPANHIGGDYYDYIPMLDGRLGIVIADVVGHGVPAALLMAKLSASVRFSFARETDPAAALNHLNRSLTPEYFDGRFITLLMLILDGRSHRLTVLNAGHLAPLVRHHDGTIELIGEKHSGWPLMIDRATTYRQFEYDLQPSDCVVLVTDGITEAMNAAGDIYGFERLRDNLTSDDPCRTGQKIIEDVQQFITQRPAKDDMCVVCCARNPA
jgi:serine phosphatase RsbU (regulator of sigma subunit)/pSer/pThr/pTyr-binding forkhead associated (FHA) protein